MACRFLSIAYERKVLKVFIIVFFLIYSMINLYVYECINRAFSLTVGYKFLILLFMFTMIVGMYIIHGKYFIGKLLTLLAFIYYSYLGFIFLLFSGLIVYDLFSLIINFINLKISYMYVFISILFITVVVFIYGYVESNNIKINHLKIKSDKIERDINIAFISDMHLGILTLQQRVDKVYNILKKLNPHIIIAGGDFVDGQHNNLEKYIKLFKSLETDYGKYAVLGNHEYYAGKDYSEDLIKSAGFVLLNNDSIAIDDLHLVITGIEDIINDSTKELNILKSRYNSNFFNIYVKHRPVVNSKATKYFDLQLSGHTHNGQIFPFGLLVKLFFKYTSGLYKIDEETLLYVSNGTLTWGPPIRVLASPEVTYITIKKNNGF